MTDGQSPSGGETAANPSQIAFQRASLLSDLGRFREALAVVDEALGHDPDDPTLLSTEGWLLIKLGRAADAQSVLSALVASQPDSPWNLYLLAAAEAGLDNEKAARAAADRALELDPNTPRYHLQVAHIAVVGKISAADRATAKERVESALTLSPDSPGGLLAAGEIYRALGETEQAKSYVARGLAIAPDDKDLHYLRAALIGDYTPTSSKDYGGIAHAAEQVAAMGEVLGMAPENVEAAQTIYGRVWGQLLRLTEAPLIMLAVVTVAVGAGMGNGAGLGSLITGVVIALAWPLFRLALAGTVLSRAPKGYLRRMIRPTGSGAWRVGGTLAAFAVGLLGVASLLWLRDAALVRVLLLLIVGGALAGGVASVFWYLRYFSAAIDSGMFAPTELGFRSVVLARKGLGRVIVWRMIVLLLVAPLAALITAMTRADAAPVLLLVVAAWALPPVAALWRVRARSMQLADEDYAPKNVTPSVVGGPALGFATLAIAAVLVLGLVQAPWLPSARDSAGTYDPNNETSEEFAECAGRPATRLACILEKRQERTDEITEELGEIEIPDFPEITVPDIPAPDITVPDIPDVPEVTVPR